MAPQSSTSTQPFKAVFLGINIIMGLLGAACFVIGMYMRFGSSQHLTSDLQATSVVAYLLIFGGVFSVLVSLLGCLGAVYENTYFLVPYFFISLLMFILLIAIGVYCFKQVHRVSEEETKFILSVINYANDTQARAHVDKVHYERKCCGMRNPKIEFKGGVPASCDTSSEVVETGGKSSTPSIAEKSYRSCMYSGSVRDYLATAGGLAIGFAVVTLLCMIGVVFLYHAIKNR